MLQIDQYAYQSRWRSLSPSVKGLAFIVLLLFALCSIPSIQVIILAILAPLTCYGARISFIKYCQWMMVPFSFLLISMIGILVSLGWENTQMIVSFHLGSLHIGINPESGTVAAQAFFRSLSCLAVTYLFVLSTPFDQLIQIGKKVRLPAALLEIILLTYRFIFIFLDEMAAIKHAQTLRFGYISMKTSYRSLGMLVTLLLTRVLSRYKQMVIALEIKLFTGDFHL